MASDLDTLLRQYSDYSNSYKGMLVNIYLVGTKRRRVALLESADLKKGERMESLFEIIGKLYPDMRLTGDPFSLPKYPRYFISMFSIDVSKIKKHSDIGKLLAMFFARDTNFLNRLVDRIGGHIYYGDISVYAEVGAYRSELLDRFKNSLQDKTRRWGDGFTWKTNFIYSTRALYNNWCILNMDFINSEIDEYVNIIYNSTALYEKLERLLLNFIERCKCLCTKECVCACTNRDCDQLYELIKTVLQLNIDDIDVESLYTEADRLVSTFDRAI